MNSTRTRDVNVEDEWVEIEEWQHGGVKVIECAWHNLTDRAERKNDPILQDELGSDVMNITVTVASGDQDVIC